MEYMTLAKMVVEIFGKENVCGAGGHPTRPIRVMPSASFESVKDRLDDVVGFMYPLSTKATNQKVLFVSTGGQFHFPTTDQRPITITITQDWDLRACLTEPEVRNKLKEIGIDLLTT